jgi:predicted amidohydrolase
MERREFLKDSAKLSALARFGLGGFVVGTSKGEAEPKNDPIPDEPPTSHIGRPVRVVSISFRMGKPLEQISEWVAQEGAQGADIIVLPETFRGQDDNGSEEPLNGATVTTLAGLAKRHQTYIACPIDRKDGNRRFNSVVLLDRKGQVVCVYNKVFPYWSEYDIKPAVEPGQEVPVHQADFGRVGFATCFDVNFPEVWQRLADLEAELVIWPSAYSAGASLQAHALNHHFYIVTSTQTPDCLVYDITGERLLYSHDQDINISRVTLDLDRGIYHEDFNIPKRDKLLKGRAEDIMQEKWMKLEQWFVLKAKRPGVSARALAREYGLEELRGYIARSRRRIDKRRGWEFAKKSWKEPTLSQSS